MSSTKNLQKKNIYSTYCFTTVYTLTYFRLLIFFVHSLIQAFTTEPPQCIPIALVKNINIPFLLWFFPPVRDIPLSVVFTPVHLIYTVLIVWSWELLSPVPPPHPPHPPPAERQSSKPNNALSCLSNRMLLSTCIIQYSTLWLPKFSTSSNTLTPFFVDDLWIPWFQTSNSWCFELN